MGIIFIKDGQILEEGSHDVLMQHDGQYKQLYLSQFLSLYLKRFNI
jgi:ATP-binding cassette subfamily B protein